MPKSIDVIMARAATQRWQRGAPDAAGEIAQVSPQTRSILLTMYSEEPYIIKALQAGVRGYVLKTQSATNLVNAIEEVMQGGFYLSPGVSRAIVQSYLGRSETSS